ncbi:hypothetical protein CupriaWKF_32990 [Cupriavidus sp. WKF15]|uniref:hypothetical protein n=1 Tax=Cupriavidus sp. WKF15 TaxID=3032282 RepID=UPI0023E2F059|nr:hypothetical protein [Cupriavidus sp. WKF15]WER51014.1 hypothetical protein CupriaWKF_32990 [Cupriavidus sp. WKF15]
MRAELAPAALALLRSHSWHGNVRQLRNVLRFALAMSDNGLIELARFIFDNAHFLPAYGASGRHMSCGPDPLGISRNSHFSEAVA